MNLYLHIPFCHSRCHYCDFCSRAMGSDPAPLQAYAARAREELEARAPGLQPDTIYIGGGTPSALSPRLLAQVLEPVLPARRCREFTIEANPEDVTTANVEQWLAMGVDRVSMGVQSLDDGELRAIGRRHDAAAALRAVATLQGCGVGNLSLDVIYGLPGQTLDSWERTLRGVLALRPSHLSAYHLTYEPGTRLTARLRAGKVQAPAEELSEAMYALLCDVTRRLGYEHYEISNFALPGRRAIHNSGYWDATPYLGIGPGAHSLAPDGSRSANAPQISQYIRDGYRATLAPDPETPRERLNDWIITRLRTSDGLALTSVAERWGRSEADALLARAARSLRAGHLTLEGDTLVIPEPAWLVADTVLLDLLAG